MEREFRRAKFKQLVLYVVKEAGELPNFGSVLLNKILVDCDFTAYKELGQAMTGQKVQKAAFGPISAPLLPVSREMMEEDGSLSQAWDQFYGLAQRKFLVERDPEMHLFSKAEIEIIDRCIQFWSKLNGSEASEESHVRFGGWTFADDGEEIPYEAAYLSYRQLTPEAMGHALGLLG